MEHSLDAVRVSDRVRGFFRRPALQSMGRELACGGAALVLATAATGSLPLPVYLGFLLSLEEGSILTAAIGCSVSAGLFWQGQEFIKLIAGIVAGLFGAAVFAGSALRRNRWFAPIAAGTISGAIGLVFLLAERTLVPLDLWQLMVQIGSAAGSAWVFGGLRSEPSPMLRACGAGLLVLGMCQMVFWQVLDLGLGAAAFCTVYFGDLPMALLCGLGADLSRITAVPITPILALGLLTARFGRRARLGPLLWSLPVMAICGRFDPVVPLGMLAGCLAAVPFPGPSAPEAKAPSPRGSARLLLGAEALDYVAELLSASKQPGPGEDFLPDRIMDRVCGDCPRREGCRDSLSLGGAPSDCPKGREVEAAAAQSKRDLRVRQQFFTRRQESETALCRQYRAISAYLRRTAGELDSPAPSRPARFRVELGTAAWGKYGQAAIGDRGAHFPGPGASYYVLLCDGMGTGHGAAAEADTALSVLTGMLRAGLPPESAMETLNDLYALRGTAGFSTADLLELRLDTGRARLFKWGAAPSYLKYRSTARALGAGSPPPGISVASAHGPEVIGLTMQRGETLVLVTDGLQDGELKGRIAAFSGRAPKDLARALLKADGPLGDDCTAVAVRLVPSAPIQ